MNLATLYADTHKLITLLQNKGYSKEQAEGFMAAIQEITIFGIATKDDLQDVRDKLKTEIVEVRSEVQAIKTSLKDAVADLLKFQVIQTIALIGVMVALFQFFGA